MFYEQSNEDISWRKLAYACGRAFRLGVILGHVIVLALALYWYGWKVDGVKKLDRYITGLTPAQQDAADVAGPHTIIKGYRGLAYYERSEYYRQPAYERRFEYTPLVLAIWIVLASGAAAALLMFISSVGRLRWRESDAVRRARHIIE